jgi:molybdenum cofactor cytidylyltransferase
MQAAGLSEVVVAALDPGDVPEDRAASVLAEALVPDPAVAALALTKPHAGRVNMKALGPGVFLPDAAAVIALNRLDPGLTLATLAPYARVAKGTLVGTVKVIAYAVAGDVLDRACDVARGALRVAPVVRKSAGLIISTVAGQKASVDAKTRKVIEGRLTALGMTLADCVTVAHDRAAMAAALPGLGGEIVLILTGSATSDLMDDAPEAVRLAGGDVARFGMPVDPGNLLFHGRLGSRPVIGLPGCARSPALNGADWVLERIACGLELDEYDIADMGLGGLLKEIPIRPQPREKLF